MLILTVQFYVLKQSSEHHVNSYCPIQWQILLALMVDGGSFSKPTLILRQQQQRLPFHQVQADVQTQLRDISEIHAYS